MDDPIVAEVRAARDAHARRLNYDIARICQNIRRHQAHCGHPVVRLKPSGRRGVRRSKPTPPGN